MAADKKKGMPNQRMFSVYEKAGPFDEERDIFRFQYDAPMESENIARAMEQCHNTGSFFLGQICDIQTAPGSIVPDHVQAVDEISYIAEGRCRWKVNDVELECGPGDVLLNKKGDVHSYITDLKMPARVFNAGVLYRDCGDAAFTEIWTMLSSLKMPVLLRGKTEVGKLFLRIIEEASNQSEYWQYSVGLILKQITLLIYRELINERMSAYNPKQYMASRSALFYQVINYMDRNIEDMHALARMPEEFHYSYSYLSHMFKSIMGYSMSTYYRQRRFAHAAELLLAENVSITDISRRMGFQTVHAFSKAFKKHFGLAPTKYIESRKLMQDWHSSIPERTIFTSGAMFESEREE